MLIAAFFILLVALCRLRLTALLWVPALFCGAWAMQITASLRLPDPLASLYAFLSVAISVRNVLELVLVRGRGDTSG